MTRILTLCLMLCALSASAIDRISSVVTITNTPSDGDTLTVNGDVRTWKTSPTSLATQISITNVVGYSATNMFNQAAAYLYSGPLTLSYSSTNGIKLVGRSGNPLVVSASGTWATITMSTQLVSGMLTVSTPISAEPTASVRTNIASDLVQAMSDYSTNTFSTASTALSNHMNLAGVQFVSGAKFFYGANMFSNAAQVIVGGYTTNQSLINITTASGTLGNLTNGTFTNPVFTNGQNYGAPFRSPGGGLGSEQFGATAVATTDGDVAVGNGATANGPSATALGSAANAGAAASVALGSVSIANSHGSIAIGQEAETDAEYAIAIGYLSVSGYTNSISLGAHSSADQAQQIKLGTSLYSTSIPGYLQVDGGISNANFVGAVTLNNSLLSPRKNITGLVNGPNSAVDTSTNYFIKIAGPSAAYQISGFNGGVNGRSVVVQKNDSWVLTILNDSGTEPGLSATNRIYTGTGADVTVTNNPGFIRLIYDTSTSHWGVESKSN